MIDFELILSDPNRVPGCGADEYGDQIHANHLRFDSDAGIVPPYGSPVPLGAHESR